MLVRAQSWALLTALMASMPSAAALADEAEEPSRSSFDEYDDGQERIESPERATLELHLGVYQPDRVANDAFDQVFGNDKGPLIGGEIDVNIVRIPYVGLLGVGGIVSWAQYKGKARLEDGSLSSEDSSLTLYPLGVVGVLRIDTLARYLNFPIVFAGKFGADMVPWNSKTGGTKDGSGFSVGFRWAAQIALELDFLEPRNARQLHEEWGINHSYLFFEAMGSRTESSLAVGDRFAWTAGLGLIL